MHGLERTRGSARRWAALLVLGLAASCALSAAAQVAYETRIEGVEAGPMRELLFSVSECLRKQGEPPASALHLRRRAARDLERFKDAFHSRGYYGATVNVALDREARPITVTFSADPGLPYVLGTIRVRAADDPDAAAKLPAPEAAGLVEGAPAMADAIAGANARILNHLRARGYPRPRIARRDVAVDHAARSVAVTYDVNPGPRAVYGEPRYEGLERTRPAVLDRLLPWAPGEPYDQRQMGELRTRLYDTGLFSTATVEPLAGEIGEDGAAPIRVAVTERPPRTMTAGIEYKTDEGAGAKFGWENRNLRGLGHRLGLETTLATELRALDLRYRIDRFRRMDQVLNASLFIGQEEREAYDSDRVEGLALVERTLSPRLTLGAGAGFRIGRVEQLRARNSHELFYFPLELRLDRSNDSLDPSNGFKFRARVAPYIDPLGDRTYFGRADLEFSYYHGWGTLKSADGATIPLWVLAARARIGAIAGASRDEVPADVRFYGGGGGSIRGYRYLTVSPLSGDDPIGGRSLAEFSLEFRRRLSESLGVVFFVDAGSAFEGAYPDFSEDLQVGAGAGIRYYTPLGPLRFDLAIPVNKRGKIDDAFQIYLSIGHAF
ncbi:MAG: BamA/TamA family outer membrane protein [Candidatus Hydrogenedentes bacterium]|nr:BamA/TamA family outer membrane protein [Candidatus Hydrogenedentota bacterium]